MNGQYNKAWIGLSVKLQKTQKQSIIIIFPFLKFYFLYLYCWENWLHSLHCKFVHGPRWILKFLLGHVNHLLGYFTFSLYPKENFQFQSNFIKRRKRKKKIFVISIVLLWVSMILWWHLDSMVNSNYPLTVFFYFLFYFLQWLLLSIYLWKLFVMDLVTGQDGHSQFLSTDPQLASISIITMF